MKATKVILPIALVLIALIAIFFLAPLTTWKEKKESQQNQYNIRAEKGQSYFKYCCQWWKDKFTGTIDGGMLPEITVTANK